MYNRYESRCRDMAQIAGKRSAMAHRTDPRIARTDQALAQAILELASQRPVSQITVADLADRAGVTRATFYNRYSSPLELLIQLLYADLERGHRREDARRAEGRYSAAQMLRLATGEVADHVERFMAVYQHALRDPADDGVYEALVRHFTDYSRRSSPGPPTPTSPAPSIRSWRNSSLTDSREPSRPGSATTR